jgi:dTDP-glucose 4,6-dehydratase
MTASGFAGLTVKLLRPHSRRVLVLIGMGAWFPATVVATMLRLEVGFRTIVWSSTLKFAAVAAGIDAVVGLLLGLYRGRRRVASLEEVVSIAWHLTVVTAIAAFVNVAVLDSAVPIGASLGAGLLTLLAVTSSRVVWRTLVAAGSRGAGTGRRTIVFGAGEAASHVITALLSEPNRELEPVAILDDDPRHARLSLRGVRVAGTRKDLPAVVDRYGAQVLLIAIADRSPCCWPRRPDLMFA